ncbi:cytochrome c oxidase subunit I [Halarchaeum sp. P4]|uniref:cytochrome c oxidase subunit I n=1 Tax=Halarchaeum sp. P4 TaxID=3421639 RepID=UPI003EC15671
MTHSEKPSGIRRWLTTVDHRDIGLLYITLGVGAGLWGAVDALMLRVALVTPAADVWGRMTYNAVFTAHGLTMLFLFATPVMFGVANYVIPDLVGADDMAFPRLNAIAFWLLPGSLVLIRIGLLSDLVGITEIRPPMTGWTFYTPLSLQKPNTGVNLVLIGLHLSGISTTMSGANFVTTIVAERDLPWGRLDIFTWAIVTTSGLALFAFPVLGAGVLMLLGDRLLGTAFFAAEGGGAMLWQHLFWFFGHPEVYILVLPPMGLLSLIIPAFSGRDLFGERFVVYSTLAIAVLSFGVWAHHMFTTGLNPRLVASFMAISLAIAVPSAVKTFNWLATMWNGEIRLTTPMLFCVGALSNFILGGVTGVFLAAVPYDLVMQGTYYVVGHFHLMLVGMVVFALFAGCYYWFPLLTGKHYNEALARIHFWLTMVGTVATFVVMLLVGAHGLPRRMATYPESYTVLQQLTTVAAFVLLFAQLVWVWNMLRSLRLGDDVEHADVWGLRERGQFTREWQAFAERLEDDREE